ncbi:hypothetical protein, partial [Burkholderia contaminans]|uniref:hypothetical protein n=1 Tax=Burkholderia contaminans TaxID=488447 RepID=UPI0031123BD3
MSFSSRTLCRSRAGGAMFLIDQTEAGASAVRRADSRLHSKPERLPLRQYASTGFCSVSIS